MASKRKAMRERIVVEQPIYEKDSYGQRRVIRHETVGDVYPATWEHTGGTETYRGRQIQASIMGVFTIRLPRDVDINPTQRVVHLNENKEYEIYSARPSEENVEGGFKYMEIFVKAIDDNG